MLFSLIIFDSGLFQPIVQNLTNKNNNKEARKPTKVVYKHVTNLLKMKYNTRSF